VGDQVRNPPFEPSRAGHAHRVRSLDGLRGVAALVVVVHHTLLASSPALANTYQGNGGFHGSAWEWLLSRTPFHILWAGPEMVLVFFVLSGYVLAIPAVKLAGRWYDSSYYPRRIARLYVPAWFAIALGAVLHELHQHRVAGASWWLNAHVQRLTMYDGSRDATLVHHSTLWPFTSVLWSLKYEVWFSLLLPLFLAAAIITRRRRLAALMLAIGCLLLAMVGADRGADTLRFMPVFILGVLLAFHIERLRPPRFKFALPVLSIACVCLLTLGYMSGGLGSSHETGAYYLAAVLGAVLAVWVALVFTTSRELLSRPRCQWLGKRSYSLYLVHEPIIVAIAFLLGGRPQTWLLLIIALPVSLLASEVFWRLVESPSVRLARGLGDRTRALVGRRKAAVSA
jgi:peptidoglycan/LPS O-acetylase OafA/YrhL